MKVDILAIGVHPDDVELSCCGTLLSHIDQGKKVALLDLTRGELGSRGSAAIRDKEAAKAAKMMGAVARENVRMADGFFEHNPENVRKIIQVIRKYQPEIVLANSITDRHPDHGRAAKLTADACYYSGLLKIETKDGRKKQKHWRPKAVYHYIQDYNIKPDFVVDIGPYIDRKMEIIQAYKTQFHTPQGKKGGPKTPISGEDFMNFIRSKGAVYGRPAGFEFGEGFTANRSIGVRNLFDLC